MTATDARVGPAESVEDVTQPATVPEAGVVGPGVGPAPIPEEDVATGPHPIGCSASRACRGAGPSGCP